MGSKIYLEAGGKIKALELPEEVKMCCPDCGEIVGDADDNGNQCRADIRERRLIHSEKEENFTLCLCLLVNCKKCGCTNKPPMRLKTYKDFKELEEIERLAQNNK